MKFVKMVMEVHVTGFGGSYNWLTRLVLLIKEANESGCDMQCYWLWRFICRLWLENIRELGLLWSI